MSKCEKTLFNYGNAFRLSVRRSRIAQRQRMPSNVSNVSCKDDPELWARIVAHDFDPEGQALTFTGRLARDHGWTIEEARALVGEYRRFCFLVMTSDRELTPSQEVDEVWHLHLVFSRDYWNLWCRSVLRQPLHHGPTQGSPAEAARFAEQYAWTLALYETVFGPPDPTWWPGTARRFGRARFITVDRDRTIVISRPKIFDKLKAMIGFVIGPVLGQRFGRAER